MIGGGVPLFRCRCIDWCSEMAKSKSESGFLRELLAIGLYKRNQGRLTRQLTAVAFGLIVFLGTWTMSQGPLNVTGPQSVNLWLVKFTLDGVWIRVGIPFLIAAVGGWIVYRAVNYSRFADFLISVEAEMDKVTWSSRAELYRATVVVIVTMIFLGVILFLYDVFWQNFFEWIGFLQIYG